MKIKDLNFDKNNYNNGNEFGNSLIEKSLRNNGAGRSILLDKNNNIIAGNKTAENASAVGLDDVIVVDSDGTKLIAVRRTDIDLDSEQGRQMALADNATAKANIEWDFDELSDVFEDDELADWGVVNLLKKVNNIREWDEDLPEFTPSEQEIKLTIIFPNEESRQQYCDANQISITHKQNNQWTSRQ